jgi:phospholipase C
LPPFVKEKPFVEGIFNAQFKRIPSDFKVLTKAEAEGINRDPSSSDLMPQQEKGIRSACALPYQIYADEKPGRNKRVIELEMKAGNEIFGARSAGIPFKVYEMNDFLVRDYAVAPGAKLTDRWNIPDGAREAVSHFRIYGPNGFFREYIGLKQVAGLEIGCDYERKLLYSGKLTGNLLLQVENTGTGHHHHIMIRDNAYKAKPISRLLKGGSKATIRLDLQRSFGWYDFTVSVEGNKIYSKRYAGHVETGADSFSDPAMGRVEI